MKQYSALSNLSHEEQEAICDLLSETITAIISNFLEMFEEYTDKMKLIIKKDGEEYGMTKISEKMVKLLVMKKMAGFRNFPK